MWFRWCGAARVVVRCGEEAVRCGGVGGLRANGWGEEGSKRERERVRVLLYRHYMYQRWYQRWYYALLK